MKHVYRRGLCRIAAIWIAKSRDINRLLYFTFYIDKCAERCPFVAFGMKLQSVVLAVVWLIPLWTCGMYMVVQSP